ncbi:hypothetical protein IQ247_11780 [Plectonema cf. radiosum LEGE 06105]|uniref:PEP-CTERM sorting domain-containing protein n=1 Tax=Plectonema cf. radiosum LEGE 06105 TaxID=945769 RepID=A0A8J7FFJ0_9CYAN|nr:hypothetical protein [Plectonema radiosum]MBE9213341.1 hypothetical protein [Plectonema cf. radiosum LEGE 06105]
MTKSIKKVFNYVFLGTIINVSATVPAQASSFENFAPDDDLRKTPQNKLSSGSKNILSETGLSNKPDYCISFPELDLCNQFTRDKNKNSLNNLLFLKAQSTIQSIEAAENIIYNTEFTSSQNQQQSNLETYTTTYTSVWQSRVPHKKKVPEPSALLGLIAFYLFAAKHRSAKNSSD